MLQAGGKQKRVRATKAAVEARRAALLDIVADMQPMTVRQVFYQATVRGVVEKTEDGYKKVQTDLVLMRKAGDLPYEWLADNTRWQRKPQSFNGVEEALKHTADFYRKDLWASADCYVEVWLEKDALAGVVMPITPADDLSIPEWLLRRDEPLCAQCGRPGGIEWDYDDLKVRLHPHCEQAWVEAHEAGRNGPMGSCS